MKASRFGQNAARSDKRAQGRAKVGDSPFQVVLVHILVTVEGQGVAEHEADEAAEGWVGRETHVRPSSAPVKVIDLKEFKAVELELPPERRQGPLMQRDETTVEHQRQACRGPSGNATHPPGRRHEAERRECLLPSLKVLGGFGEHKQLQFKRQLELVTGVLAGRWKQTGDVGFSSRTHGGRLASGQRDSQRGASGAWRLRRATGLMLPVSTAEEVVIEGEGVVVVGRGGRHLGRAVSGASSGVLRDSSSRPGKATCSSPGWLLLPRERHGHGKGTTSSRLTVKSKRGHGVCHLSPKRTPDRPARPVRR